MKKKDRYKMTKEKAVSGETAGGKEQKKQEKVVSYKNAGKKESKRK
ncbi:MAG: hypothetical protein NTX26_03145 [Candidatus Parcubacteria bacterium]|nr:hypothetical protein [Candidatus Parcubacteria bacterium]